jgi:hypothetical protein
MNILNIAANDITSSAFWIGNLWMDKKEGHASGLKNEG